MQTAAEPNELVSSPVLQAGIIGMMVGSTVLMTSPAWQTEQSAFTVVDAGDRRIRVEWTPGMGDPPPPGTTAEIRCSLPDGRYLMTGVFEEASSLGLVFLIGPQIRRAQMRRDFRVDVPRDTGIRYELDRVGEFMACGGLSQLKASNTGSVEFIRCERRRWNPVRRG
jgi:hypothetical protein